MNNNDVVVSIRCFVYNHEPYLRQCLEGFVMQKTNFKFEAIVHDDASTDGSAAIIREYAAKYPDIIKPIFETENQYSKHDGSLKRIMDSHMRGKYVALCEGDDYWTDPLKLQKQVTCLENNPTIDICACSAEIEQSGKKNQHYGPSKENQIFTTEQVILGGGGFVATATLMYRKDLIFNEPPFKKFMSFDYSMQIYGALRGGMAYLGDVVATYRYMTLNSWTHSMKKNKKSNIAHIQKLIEFFKILDKDTEGKFHNACEYKIDNLEFKLLYIQGMYKSLLCPKFKKIFKKHSIKFKCHVLFRSLFQ